MADRHRAADAGAVFEAACRWSRPISTSSAAFNPKGELKAYPGSPLIARALLRPQDRLVRCELEPKARKRLIGALRRDAQARVVDLDGWVALPAFVPPKERRGLVLIDPPFEPKDEFEKLGDGFAAGLREMADRQLCDLVSGEKPPRHRHAGAISRAARAAQAPGKCLRLEFSVAPQLKAPPLTSAGL